MAKKKTGTLAEAGKTVKKVAKKVTKAADDYVAKPLGLTGKKSTAKKTTGKKTAAKSSASKGKSAAAKKTSKSK